MKIISPTSKPILLKPIHSNLGVEAKYRRDMQALIKEMSDEFIKEIATAWEDRPPLTTIAQDKISPTGWLSRIMERLGEKWKARFDQASRTLGHDFARGAYQHGDKAMMAVLKKAGFAVKFTMSPAATEAYDATIAENVGLIKSIPQEYLKGVQQLVWNSVTQGHDLHALTEGLKERYGVTRRRAAFIATDQNNKARSTLEKVRRQELGITQAIWMHSGGGRHPRQSHVNMDGKPFDIEKGMYDPSVDEHIQPGFLINCRCTSRAIIPGLT